MGRSPCCDKSKVKRGTWSQEEDAILKNYLQNHGLTSNWIALPHKAGLKRCGKSCRLRWLNYLRPDIKLGGFTQDEEYIICNLYNKIGSRWSVIASHLLGRTDNDVKNYWNTKLKKKLMATMSDAATTASASVSEAATTSQMAPPEFNANVPINFGPSRLTLEGSSDDFLSGGNELNFPFYPYQFEQYSSNEVKMEDFSWEVRHREEVDEDLFSTFQFDSKPYGLKYT